MIDISELASEKIKQLMAADGMTDAYLRLGVKTGGCSGFTYGMGIDEEVTEADDTLELNGLKVVMEKDSVKYLRGLQIDYKESAMGGGFTINNPNAIATCGCGSSFRTKEEAGVPGEC
ncbi:iron-sulfur cluster assembly accessory protein [Paenibacillus antri]|uniref:Iron-sulfur cluster assembly accessory protein n=1 Tax=Paenibacillus antri TaxID=2582848 RepID=A0A5R9GAA2_9BACL|nr:iron-sulfur cluster assembly accessory protein [Paenibacillus antri]TLS53372.1 iron-sulfur cluster assembly accessory protein [Paenibacillus antri]